MNALAQFRSLPLRTRVLLATNAVNSFGGGLVLPFLWAYLTEVRGMAAWVPATTLALQAATAMLGGLAWGVLVDRLPYRTVVPAVMMLAGSGTALYAFAATPPLALLAAVVYGLGISGVGTVLRTMYAATTSGPARAAVYALDFGIFNAMTGLGVIAGGLVATAPFGSAVARYAALYLGDGATFGLTGLVAGLLLPAAAHEGSAGARPAPGGYLAVLRDPRLAAVLLLMLLTSFVSYGQFKAGLPGYLLASGALGPGGLSFAFALNIVTVVLAQFLVMPRLGRIPRTFQVAASGAVFAASWLCVLAAGHQRGSTALAWVALAVVLLSAGSVLVVPVLTALLNDLAADRVRGRANALFSIAISGGAVLGPLVAGTLLARQAGSVLIAVLVAASLGASALVLAGRGRVPSDLDLAALEPEPAC